MHLSVLSPSQSSFQCPFVSGEHSGLNGQRAQAFEKGPFNNHLVP